MESDDGEEGREETDVVDLSPTPEERTLENERKEDVLRALNTLSDKHREIVVLRYMDGYSVNEIADILSLDEGTVKSRLFRAREKLKIILD